MYQHILTHTLALSVPRPRGRPALKITSLHKKEQQPQKSFKNLQFLPQRLGWMKFLLRMLLTMATLGSHGMRAAVCRLVPVSTVLDKGRASPYSSHKDGYLWPVKKTLT